MCRVPTAWAAVHACLVLDGVVCLALSGGLSGCRASVLCVRVGCRAGPVLEIHRGCVNHTCQEVDLGRGSNDIIPWRVVGTRRHKKYENKTKEKSMCLIIIAGLPAASFVIKQGRPLGLGAAAAFFVDSTWGPALTSGQQLLLERQQLNQMTERYRPAGRYDAPVYDRRLLARYFIARDEVGNDTALVGTAGIELAVVDLGRSLVMRRSRGEAILRDALGIRLPAQALAPPSYGRSFHRRLTLEEEAEERALLQEQENQFDAAERDSQLVQELVAATEALPTHLSVWPLLSCVAVAASRRQEGVGTALCRAAEEQATRWGFDRVLAQCDEDNEAANKAAMEIEMANT